jgi:hypothetical protein
VANTSSDNTLPEASNRLMLTDGKGTIFCEISFFASDTLIIYSISLSSEKLK